MKLWKCLNLWPQTFSKLIYSIFYKNGAPKWSEVFLKKTLKVYILAVRVRFSTQANNQVNLCGPFRTVIKWFSEGAKKGEIKLTVHILPNYKNV
jgi:hypothetical protein